MDGAGYFMSQRTSCLIGSKILGSKITIMNIRSKKNILNSKRIESILPSILLIRSLSLPSVLAISSRTLTISAVSLPSVLAKSSLEARCSMLVICVSAKTLESPRACASLNPASFRLSTAFIVSNVNAINNYNLTFLILQPLKNT
ncbi:hypothetical protein MCHI_000313 [Candidatus Magnetoovum chiemensis]|nr:hypothetical protein MCHI_000313 [Candidatus Magnetoovum chiemensis]